jgi:molecular chaperone DnaK
MRSQRRRNLESNDVSAIKSAQEELTRSSHKIAEAMYAKAGGELKAGLAEAEAQEGPKKAPEDVVDDYEDVGKK